MQFKFEKSPSAFLVYTKDIVTNEITPLRIYENYSVGKNSLKGTESIMVLPFYKQTSSLDIGERFKPRVLPLPPKPMDPFIEPGSLPKIPSSESKTLYSKNDSPTAEPNVLLPELFSFD